MNVEFNSILEDGSALLIARTLLRYFVWWKAGNTQQLISTLSAENAKLASVSSTLSSSKKAKDQNDNNDDVRPRAPRRF